MTQSVNIIDRDDEKHSRCLSDNHDNDDDDDNNDKSQDLSPPSSSSSIITKHVKIDEIVLVGGSSRMPCLRAAIRRGCGRLGYVDFSLDHGES